MKVTEKALFPGTCFICGQHILTNDIIVKSFLGVNPVAAHAICDPEVNETACHSEVGHINKGPLTDIMQKLEDINKLKPEDFKSHA